MHQAMNIFPGNRAAAAGSLPGHAYFREKTEYECIGQNWVRKYRPKLSMNVLDKKVYESIG